MKAKPVTYEGINFRSTLEVKHYINMTEVFGWEVEYEPTIEDLRGWLPDFLIKGCQRDILVEVKPIRCLEEWENHPDYGKVINSGILNTNTLSFLEQYVNSASSKINVGGSFFKRTSNGSIKPSSSDSR